MLAHFPLFQSTREHRRDEGSEGSRQRVEKQQKPQVVEVSPDWSLSLTMWIKISNIFLVTVITVDSRDTLNIVF